MEKCEKCGCEIVIVDSYMNEDDRTEVDVYECDCVVEEGEGEPWEVGTMQQYHVTKRSYDVGEIAPWEK